MHESLGSAADGAMFLKDYGSSAGGGNNVYHVTLYRSFDGVDWNSVEVPTPTDQQSSQAACRGWNCVVLSDFPQDGSMLVTDDGIHWDRVETAPRLLSASITAGRTGFVLSGHELLGSQNRLLFSSTGRDWQDMTFEAGSHHLDDGIAYSDDTAGWFLIGGYTPSGRQPVTAFALSTDGRLWHDVEDPDGLYSAQNMVRQTVVHFAGRWYVLGLYRQMPADYTSGGFGMPASTSTPIATWQTIYWIDDGSTTLHASRTLSTLPDEVVAMDGYLVGAKSNPDFTATLMISTDALHWTDQGLLPPGVPQPASIHGIPVYYLPQMCRAGENVVMQGIALGPDEMGAGLYVAKAQT